MLILERLLLIFRLLIHNNILEWVWLLIVQFLQRRSLLFWLLGDNHLIRNWLVPIVLLKNVIQSLVILGGVILVFKYPGVLRKSTVLLWPLSRQPFSLWSSSLWPTTILQLRIRWAFQGLPRSVIFDVFTARILPNLDATPIPAIRNVWWVKHTICHWLLFGGITFNVTHS